MTTFMFPKEFLKPSTSVGSVSYFHFASPLMASPAPDRTSSHLAASTLLAVPVAALPNTLAASPAPTGGAACLVPAVPVRQWEKCGCGGQHPL